MSINLHVLGKSPAWPEPDGASSGYLVDGDGARILVDCGHGVAGKLRAVCEPHDLDAVVLSHLHMDHCADLTAVAYALRYMPHPRSGVRPLLLVGPGAPATLRQLGALWDSPDLFALAFEVREYRPAQTVDVGGLQLRFAAVPHAVPTHAVAVSDGEHQLVYGADCGPNDTLVELAAGCDLLIAEATVPEPDPQAIHLCARQAGELAARAHAKRCMLTHFADAYDVDWVAAQGALGFGAPVELAAGGLRTGV